MTTTTTTTMTTMTTITTMTTTMTTITTMAATTTPPCLCLNQLLTPPEPLLATHPGEVFGTLLETSLCTRFEAFLGLPGGPFQTLLEQCLNSFLDHPLDHLLDHHLHHHLRNDDHCLNDRRNEPEVSSLHQVSSKRCLLRFEPLSRFLVPFQQLVSHSSGTQLSEALELLEQEFLSSLLNPFQDLKIENCHCLLACLRVDGFLQSRVFLFQFCDCLSEIRHTDLRTEKGRFAGQSDIGFCQPCSFLRRSVVKRYDVTGGRSQDFVISFFIRECAGHEGDECKRQADAHCCVSAKM